MKEDCKDPQSVWGDCSTEEIRASSLLGEKCGADWKERIQYFTGEGY